MNARLLSRRTALAVFVLAALFWASFPAGPALAKKPTATPDYFFHKIVDYDFVKQFIKIPKPDYMLLIDSRPYDTKYALGYIPTAVSLPDSQFEKLAPTMLPKDKNALLVFYCEGPECKLSHSSAKKAEAMGYKNVVVYAAGFPDYAKKAPYVAVAVEYVHGLLTKGDPYLLVDARPHGKFLEGAIPSSINIPDTAFEASRGLLPTDKKTPLVFYCGGYDCKLSHKEAVLARKFGYSKVMVCESGYPAWTAKYGAGAAAAAAKKAGPEGAIDIEKFKKDLAANPGSMVLIDVRDADEFAKGHFPTAKNIPVGKLEKDIASLPTDKPVVFVCATGARSGEAFYMVLDKRPDAKNIFYIEAQTKFHPDGKADITPNKK